MIAIHKHKCTFKQFFITEDDIIFRKNVLREQNRINKK